jgi:energy-coupling factor transport system substrate-specific component
MSKSGMKGSFISTNQCVAMAVGTALYAALTIPFTVYQIPSAGGLISVGPTVVIPILFGFVFGPLTGFVTGFVGKIFSDYLALGGSYWNWDIGNGLLGAIPGLGYYVVRRTDWTKARTLALAAVLSVVASVLGTAFAVLADYSFGLTTLETGLVRFYSVGGTDAINGLIITPIVLYAYARATAARAR